MTQEEEKINRVNYVFSSKIHCMDEATLHFRLLEIEFSLAYCREMIINQNINGIRFMVRNDELYEVYW
jgi:hypothetical protein